MQDILACMCYIACTYENSCAQMSVCICGAIANWPGWRGGKSQSYDRKPKYTPHQQLETAVKQPIASQLTHLHTDDENKEAGSHRRAIVFFQRDTPLVQVSTPILARTHPYTI